MDRLRMVYTIRQLKNKNMNHRNKKENRKRKRIDLLARYDLVHVKKKKNNTEDSYFSNQDMDGCSDKDSWVKEKEPPSVAPS